MTSLEAVTLSYLEWVRLIGTGTIRLDERRIFRWRHDRVDPVDVVCNLMLGAPDLGTSSTGFVLAMLKPELLDQLRTGDLYLGQRLHLEAVRSFHSFSEAALAVHRHDAEAAGLTIDLTPLAAGWAEWVLAVEAADRRARGESLLAILDVPPCDHFVRIAAWLKEREQCIVDDDIARSRDSMFFGWACVLNSQKIISGAAPSLPPDVKEEADALRRDFNVDQPFLARAPLLSRFVGSLAGEREQPAYLLAMASLKQHERYVIKREGAALDLPSLMDDIRILSAHDHGAASLLVQSLGERLPGELIRALKAKDMSSAGEANEALALTQEEASRAQMPVDEKADKPARDLPEPQRLPGALSVPDFSIETEHSSGELAGSARETVMFAEAEAPTVLSGEAVSEPSKKVDAMTQEAGRPQVVTNLDQPGLDFGPEPPKQEVMISPSADSSAGLVSKQRAEDGRKPALKARGRVAKKAGSKKKEK
ncbi:hypothetical protein ACRDNQ_03720 [Palleronia sp. KMU-117]|uniref:hypothetical protein n=1 Tax=Palleronia sp. KMU-117 TaxID=3434108 RepID=UPI003D735F12